MRSKMIMVHMKAGQFLKRCKAAILDRRGEGFVDTAVFS